MEYDQDKVDEAVLYLNFFRDGAATRAWKGFDWGTMDRLPARGYISDPKSKTRSVISEVARELFWQTSL